MCEHCRNIQTWRKFDAPKDYLACIAYIQQLVSEGEFELMPCAKVTEAGMPYRFICSIASTAYLSAYC